MTQISDDEVKDRAQQAATGGPQPGEIYRHYKGGLYVVVCRSLKEDTLEPLVTYRSNARGTFWTRTLADFTAGVVTEGDDLEFESYVQRRFERVNG